MQLHPPQGLLRRADFLRVQTQGRRYRGAYMLVIAAANPTQSRVGYTVSRRVGGAVVRNRVRRRLREVVRLAPGSLLAQTDYVVIAHPSAAGCSYAQLREELLCLLRRVSHTRASYAAPSRRACLQRLPSTG